MDSNLFDKEYKPEAYYMASRPDMIQFIPTTCRKILEVGCGQGNFANIIKHELNAEVWAIELCPSAAKEAALKIDKVLIANFETDTVDLPNQYFDCIIFNDVLEHFAYPWNILKKASQYLSDSGVIVASIPNIRYWPHIKEYLWHKKWHYSDQGILDKTHLRFFTQNSIKELFGICNYKILTLKGIHETECPLYFKIVNLLLRDRFCDMKYLHFVCVATKQKGRPQ
jgi:2-polyprenyl-3-methyl-5-hydroxy-6-metoxy-1,4-benzoquinol methylase